MKLLEEEIKKNGKVLPGDVLKVGSFINQQMDAKLVRELGKEIYNHFKNSGINKILTVEASGIAFAIVTAEFFDCKMTFAKKSKSLNADGGVYSSECKSYTRNTTNTLILPKEYLTANDNVLIVDDFLAVGNASRALMEIVKQSGAKLCGVASIIEKGYQGGGDKLREEGVDVFSLAIIDAMDEKEIVFRKQ